MSEQKQKGQVGIGQLIGIGVSMVLAAVGGYFAQVRVIDIKIEDVKAKQVELNTSSVQRITKLETDVPTMKEDIKEIKADIKILLRRSN